MMVAPKAISTRGAPKAIADMTPEEKARADDIDLRCLSLCIGMLERVNGVRGYFLYCIARMPDTSVDIRREFYA